MKLYKLDLIEEMNNKQVNSFQLLHGARFFRLTTGGIFNLMLNGFTLLRISKRMPKTIFTNYGNDIIFKTLVYPFFERRTLLKFSYSNVLISLFNFLKKCCEITTDTIHIISDPEEFTWPLFDWNSVPNDPRHNNSIKLLLEGEFRVDTSSAVFKKSLDGKVLSIITDTHSVKIVLDKKKNTANMLIDNEKIYEFIIDTKHENPFDRNNKERELILMVRAGSEQIYIDKFVHQILYHLTIMAFSTVIGLSRLYELSPTTFDMTDYKILAGDKKIWQLFSEVKQIFSEHYDALASLTPKSS